MPDNNIIQWWLIEEYDDRDYMLAWEMMPILEEKTNIHKKVVRTNQHRDPHGWSCSVFGMLSSIVYNTGLNITQQDIDNASQQAIDEGVIVPGRGATFIAAANFCKKWVSERYNVDLTYYRVPLGNSRINAIAKERAINVGYYTSLWFSRDTQEDGIASEKDYERGTGHLVHKYMTMLTIFPEPHIYYHNSYEGVITYNQFAVEYPDELRRNGFFMPRWYIFINLDDMENTQLQQDIQDIQEAYSLWITKNKQNIEDVEKWNYTDDVRMILFVMRARRIDS